MLSLRTLSKQHESPPNALSVVTAIKCLDLETTAPTRIKEASCRIFCVHSQFPQTTAVRTAAYMRNVYAARFTSNTHRSIVAQLSHPRAMCSKIITHGTSYRQTRVKCKRPRPSNLFFHVRSSCSPIVCRVDPSNIPERFTNRWRPSPKYHI